MHNALLHRLHHADRGIQPSMQQRFTDYGATLDPRMTFARSSKRWVYNSAGVLTEIASGVAAAHAYQDHDPITLQPLGLAIEQQSINQIRDNTTFTNRGTYTAGGFSETLVGSGTENGIEYIDLRIQGTAAGAVAWASYFETATGIAAANNQTWTNSAFLKVVGGSTANIASIRLSMDLHNGAGAFLATITGGALTLNGSASRLSASRLWAALVAANASTAYVRPFLSITGAASGAIDITIRIGLPQHELHAKPTSPIKTYGSAVTRLVDAASFTGSNFTSWFRSEGTFVLRFRIDHMGLTGIFPGVITINDGTSNNQLQLVILDGTTDALAYEMHNGGVQRVNINHAAIVAGTIYKAAFDYKTDSYNSALNGNLAAEDTSGTMPSVNRLQLGVERTGAYRLNGHIQELLFYPRQHPRATTARLPVA